MFWLKKFPWLSLLLLFATYCAFGWYVAKSSYIWNFWLIEYGRGWGWELQEDFLAIVLYFFSGVVILIVTFGLTAPVALLTFFMGSPLKTDFRAMLSVLLWSFAVVIIFTWLRYFAHLLLLVSSAILARLGLQESGCNKWQTGMIVSLISICSFIFGILLATEFRG